MNKGLELIEAGHLFAMEAEQVEIIVHPQSVIHSMVVYLDGSVLAQLGSPDMRTPIAHNPGLAKAHAGAGPPPGLGGGGQPHFRAARSDSIPGTQTCARCHAGGGVPHHWC